LADSGVDRAQHTVVEHDDVLYVYGGADAGVQMRAVDAQEFEHMQCLVNI
jgi:hypothetical protein